MQEKYQIKFTTKATRKKKNNKKKPLKVSKSKNNNNNKYQSKNMKINEVDYSEGHRKKQENFRQTCTSALLTTPKPLTV